jgi:hypothetical protein
MAQGTLFPRAHPKRGEVHNRQCRKGQGGGDHIAHGCGLDRMVRLLLTLSLYDRRRQNGRDVHSGWCRRSRARGVASGKSGEQCQQGQQQFQIAVRLYAPIALRGT